MLIRTGGALILGTGLVLLTGGCPLLEIEAEVKEVCLTYADVKVPAADGKGEIDQSFVFDDLGKIDELDRLDANVEFLHVVLRAKSGVDNLGFLQAAHVTVASGDPASTLPELTIVDCGDGSCVSDGSSELTLLSGSKADALAYLRSDSVVVNVNVAGQLPDKPWTMDVDVCVKGKVRFAQEL